MEKIKLFGPYTIRDSLENEVNAYMKHIPFCQAHVWTTHNDKWCATVSCFVEEMKDEEVCQ
jgi:hypothetical protein